ncbi:SpoIVB peptidase [Caldibacillus debilis]|uniref:SpoIVB peptidase n=2 Tax=Caldibacillus debilis TaxID=301148 RepID=UPI0003620520
MNHLKTDAIRKTVGFLLLVSFVFFGFFTPAGKILQTPFQLTLFEGQEQAVSSAAGIRADSGSDRIGIAYKEEGLAITGKRTGNGEVTVHYGSIPLKKVDVQVLENIRVVPGGQSIGVKIHSKGVLVVGHHLVETDEGTFSPGEKAGIRAGDLIVKMNGKTVEELADISPYVQESGRKGTPLSVLVQRHDGKTFEAKITPAKAKGDEKYKLGLYIRDSAAGIGTMTFYDPKTKKYGALGHVISDMDTRLPIAVKDGYIVPSTVTSIQKGTNGSPGEKMARILADKERIGNIFANSQFGIFGTLDKPVENGMLDQAIPIALSHQVKKGPAEILTVVENNKVERFQVKIISTVPQKFPATKGLVIKVTDPRLLEKTGGIVQGMSGSPIIQNGRLIGAVTHVFVNDPTTGYGVHIEWMLNEAGIKIPKKELEKAG